MNVIITGASAGIGLELVKIFAQQPNTTVYAVVRSASQVEQFSEFKKNVVPVVQDLSTDDLLNFKKVFTNISHVDILINNAGVLVKKAFYELNEEDWMQTFTVNLFSTVRIIRYLLPLMGYHAPTHIVNIGSMGGVQGAFKYSGLSAYSASKSALNGLTEALAEEFKDKNVFVNCLALGAVQTKMFEKAFPSSKTANSPQKIAQYIYDFALNGYKYFNGKILPVATSTP
jgi:NAD(P)-dependent dehydrogenase (short-subunit alcohol dehydrogenase family)